MIFDVIDFPYKIAIYVAELTDAALTGSVVK